jgi:hypothetical protein
MLLSQFRIDGQSCPELTWAEIGSSRPRRALRLSRSEGFVQALLVRSDRGPSEGVTWSAPASGDACGLGCLLLRVDH